MAKSPEGKDRKDCQKGCRKYRIRRKENPIRNPETPERTPETPERMPRLPEVFEI
jgi:hypothetical protein